MTVLIWTFFCLFPGAVQMAFLTQAAASAFPSQPDLMPGCTR